MEFLADFNRIMEKQSEIALASCVDNQPNVRIVNFVYHPDNKGVVYFATFRGNPKTKEFALNPQAALSTVPLGTNEHVRIQQSTVSISELTVYDLKDAFVAKVPDYASIIEQAGSELDLYEIHFKQATVTIDYTRSGSVSF